MLKIGTRIVFEHEDYERIEGEIVDMNDPRFKGKFAHSEDICVLWDNGQKITYDKEWFCEHQDVVKPLENQKSEG